MITAKKMVITPRIVYNRSMRFVLLALACLLVIPATSQAYVFGVSDMNNPDMFTQQPFQDLHVQSSRYLVNWDSALTNNRAAQNADLWYAQAVQSKTDMLVSFGGYNKVRGPSKSQYQRGVKAAMKRWPKVKNWQAWNEANFHLQSSAKHPKEAATYATVLDKLCKRKCTSVPVTVAFSSKYYDAAKWIKKFLKYYKKTPKIWALHDYKDVSNPKYGNMKRFIKQFKKGAIWITETSSWARHLHTPVLNWDLERQASQVKNVFAPVKRYPKRVKRLYWYEYQGTDATSLVTWDSALVSADGALRPAYWKVVAQRNKDWARRH